MILKDVFLASFQSANSWYALLDLILLYPICFLAIQIASVLWILSSAPQDMVHLFLNSRSSCTAPLCRKIKTIVAKTKHLQ